MTLIALSVAPAHAESFRRLWRDAGRSPVPTNSIAGRWVGTWQNTNNTHRDELQAVIRRTGLHEWRADFHARYGRLLTFTQSVVLVGDENGETVEFKGQQDLGFLAGGIYKYSGKANPTNFFSTYDSKYDVGTFTLRRP